MARSPAISVNQNLPSLVYTLSSSVEAPNFIPFVSGGTAPFTYALTSGDGQLDSFGNLQMPWSTSSAMVTVTDSRGFTSVANVHSPYNPISYTSNRTEDLATGADGSLLVIWSNSAGVFVEKYSAQGYKVWNSALAVCSGCVHYAALDTDGTARMVTLTGNGSAVVTTFSSGGTVASTKTFKMDSVSAFWVTRVIVNSSGVTLAGRPNDFKSLFVRKFDWSGNILWDAQVALHDGIAVPVGIVNDSNGNTIASTVDASAVMVAKFDSSGNQAWQSVGPRADIASSVRASSAGDIYVQYSASSTNSPAICSFDLSGALRWQTTIDLSSSGLGAASTTTAGIFDIDVNGNSYVEVSGPPAGSSTNFTFLVKVDSRGALSYATKRTIDSANITGGTHLHIGADGAVYALECNGTSYFSKLVASTGLAGF